MPASFFALLFLLVSTVDATVQDRYGQLFWVVFGLFYLALSWKLEKLPSLLTHLRTILTVLAVAVLVIRLLLNYSH